MEFKNNLPGETAYDKACTDASAAAEPQTPSQEPAPQPSEVEPARKKEPDVRHQLAVASFIIGIASLLIIFILPFFGLAFAAIGGVIGIVMGALSRKEHAALAWTGIILSILSLVVVLLSFIVLCVVGWGLLLSVMSQVSSGFGGFGGFDGFYFP